MRRRSAVAKCGAVSALVDCAGLLDGEHQPAKSLGCLFVAEAPDQHMAFAGHLARDQPPGDVEAVGLAWCDCRLPSQPCVVCHPRRRGELTGPVRSEHEDADPETATP